MPPTPPDPLIGSLIDGRFQVRDRIARGGMATVYRALDRRLDRTVAVKVMHPHLAHEPGFSERFLQEARASARLTHPNVVGIIDQGHWEGYSYLVMEYLPSRTLRDVLLQRGKLSPEQAMQVLEAVLAGLAAAHRADLVHRDIKPENILLADNGGIKIGDFGLARMSSNHTATGTALLGTIAYLSPELVTRSTADKRSDIYSVGIVLFEMLTGKQPYSGDEPMQIAYRHAHDTVPLPSTIEPGIPRSLDQLVHWATHRDPNLRPEDADVMLEEVRRIGEHGLEPGMGLTQTRVLPRAETGETEILARPSKRALARFDEPDTDDLGRLGAVAAPSGATAMLTRKSASRRKRGLIWLMLVAFVTIGLVATGLWFSMGPGATATVPRVAGATLESAQQLLQEAGFTEAANVEEEPDYDVAAGTVIRSNPQSGTIAARDVVVTLVVSTGRRQLPAPDLTTGLNGQQAQEAIAEAEFVYDEALNDRRFTGDVPRGVVMQGLLAGGEAFAPGQELEERTPMGYMLSLGAIPDTAGMTRENAERALSDVQLTATIEETHNAEVAAGTVIEARIPDGTVREGDTVTLVVSLGPVMVDVPNLVGESFDSAIAQLEGLGFTVDAVSSIPKPLWGALQVASQEPGEGQAPEGSTITLRANF